MREKTSYGTSEMTLISIYVGEVPVVGDQRSCEDPTAVQILQQYQPSLLQRYSPRYVAADGNCCYTAVVLALFGTADFHLHVCVLAAAEMLRFPSHYNVNSPNYVGALAVSDIFTSPIEELMDAVLREGGYAELMHLYAISAATGVVLQSYMPPVMVCQPARTPARL